jgi:hypothetical protein
MHHLMRRPTGGRWIRLAILFLLLLPTRHDTGDRLHAPHIERGRQVAQRYEAHGRRLVEYYASLAAAARQSAPDLLAYLQPRSPLLTGYQVLPPILRAAPERRSAPASAAYSWPWTDRLIDGALREIERAEADLAGAKADPRRSRAILQRLALDYSRLSAQRANIDAHIQYNRLWQAAIVADRAGYDQATILYDQILEYQKITDGLHRVSAASERSAIAYAASLRLTETSINLVSRAQSLSRRIDAALSGVNTPSFVKVQDYGGTWVIRVPLFTDIEDREFVHAVKQIIESFWQAAGRSATYRVQLDVSFISPDLLYPDGDKPGTGQKLDLNRHLRQFPTGGAVLTTGGLTTHVLDHAIILGPQSLAPRVLAHEFGHILGFRDRYVRGYRNLGWNGFLVTEVVANPEDIMAATPYGAVFPGHFENIINRPAANLPLIPASRVVPLTTRPRSKT